MELNKVVQKCLKGDEGAWNVLVNSYSKKIFNMAYQFSGSYNAAEDLTQEIFLKLYTCLSKYDTQKNFSAWLLTLTKNYLIDEYRRTKWEKTKRDDFNDHLFASPASDGPEHGVLRKESKKLIWDSLNQLTSETRMVVILRDIQGKSYMEISEVLELPLGTVKSRVNRGRLFLAKILKEKKERNHEM